MTFRALGILLCLSASASADAVFLKGGQRIEGEPREVDKNYEIETDEGTLTVPKKDVERIVKSPAKIEAEAGRLHKQARSLWEEANRLQESDPDGMNARLKEGVELLKKIVDLYSEAIETYTDEKHAHFPKELVKICQEMRIYRGKMVSEIASKPAPPPKKEKKEEKKEEETEVAKKPEPPPAPKKEEKPEPAEPKVDVDALLAGAKKGDVDAMLALGRHLDERENKPEEALDWYKRASRKRSAEGYYRMALMAIDGRGMDIDYKQAESWLFRAASNDCPLAQVQIGVMHFEGMGVPRSIPRADTWCAKAYDGLGKEADAGDPEALTALGWMFLEGLGVAPDPDRMIFGRMEKKAVECFRRAAQQKHAPAQARLGMLYDEGKGVDANREEALKWLTLAADQGYAAAQVRLGEMHDTDFYRRENPHVDYGVARKWYEKAAEKGHPNAFFRLGFFYEGGRGGTKNRIKAVELYEKALERATGMLRAQIYNDLGAHYYEGTGVRQDRRKAMQYFLAAAQLGLPMAQGNVGVHYQNNGSVKEAIKWYVFASKNGFAPASENLGDVYCGGRGIPKNLWEAERWYLEGIQQGSEDCKGKLANVRSQLNDMRRR